MVSTWSLPLDIKQTFVHAYSRFPNRCIVPNKRFLGKMYPVLLNKLSVIYNTRSVNLKSNFSWLQISQKEKDIFEGFLPQLLKQFKSKKSWQITILFSNMGVFDVTKCISFIIWPILRLGQKSFKYFLSLSKDLKPRKIAMYCDQYYLGPGCVLYPVRAPS